MLIGRIKALDKHVGFCLGVIAKSEQLLKFLYWPIVENVMLIYDGFMNYWFVHVNIELSLVVGWFEVELLSDSRFP